MASYQIKSYDELVSDMIAWIVSHSATITDLSPGSVIRSYCEAAGLCLEEIYVSVYLGFRRYLDQIQETAFEFPKKSGTKASTNVIFSRAIATPSAKTINVGTVVKTQSGLSFLSTAIATIPANQLNSNSVEVEAEEVGVSYNVLAGTIIVIATTIDGVDSVTNALPAVGGVNAETQYQYKKRFQAYIEGLGRSNIAGLIYGALSVEGITSASLQELFPPVGNVNVRLYVDDGSSNGVSVAKVAEVQGVIDGGVSEQNPGYRAAGINAVVYAPSVVTQNITMTVNVIAGVDIDQIEEDIISVLTAYVNNLGVGSAIIKNELIAGIMSVYGITDCNVSVPAGNVSIASSQVGRVGVISVVVS